MIKMLRLVSVSAFPRTTQIVLRKGYDPELFKPHVVSKRLMFTRPFLEECYAD